MTIVYHDKIVQGSEEWKALRMGMLTASKISRLVTAAKLETANNDDVRKIIFQLTRERVTNFMADEFQSFAMRRGNEEELYARSLYSEHYAPVHQTGFVTNDRLGFLIGWSPDGLVGEDGGIECKSRDNDLQVKVILDGVVPAEHVIQVQSSIFVSERKWIDYCSYSNGMPMFTVRAEPIDKVQEAIEKAVIACEKNVKEKVEKWHDIMSSNARLIPTERRNYEEEIS